MSPIREYRCPVCDRKVSIHGPTGENPQPPCCSCGEWMERVISRTGKPIVKNGTPNFHNRGSE